MSQAREKMQAKVHSTIPVSRYMGYEITVLTETTIQTRAPLQANINIHGTGFAGSLYSLAALTAWSFATHVIERHALDAELVIANADIKYAMPVESDIECYCEVADSDIKKFIDALADGRRARLSLEVSINEDRALLKALMVATPRV